MAEKTSNQVDAPISDVRQKIVAEFNQTLLALYQKVNERFSQLSTGVLLVMWQIGEFVTMVKNDTDGAKYGENAITRLAAALGRSTAELYNACTLRQNYSKEEITQISKTQLANGDYVSWRHMQILCQITSGEDRKKMLDKTVAEGWTSDELSNAINKAGTRVVKHHRKGGRAVGMPKTPFAAAKQVVRELGRLNKRVPVWVSSLVDKLDGAPADDLDTAVQKAVQEALTVAETAQAEFDNLVTRLKATAQHVDTTLERSSAKLEKPEKSEKKPKPAKARG